MSADRKLKILVACEESQILTSALISLGHDAYSCDLYNSSGSHPEKHICKDVRSLLNHDWDIIFAFPPCTYLTRAQQFRVNKCHLRKKLQLKACEFVKEIFNSKCPRIIIENPPGYLVHGFRKYDQLIEPYYFGDNHRKEICLWLKGVLPMPIPQSSKWNRERKSVNNHVNGRMSSAERSKIRSKFFKKTALHMAKWYTSPCSIALNLFDEKFNELFDK